jgi:FkbM family methyltransferase
MEFATVKPDSCRLKHAPPANRRDDFRLTLDDAASGRLDGFHDPEIWNDVPFRWTGPKSSIWLDLPRGGYQVTIDTGGLRGPRCDFEFSLYWNDVRVARNQIRVDGGQVRFRVPASLCKEGRKQRLSITAETYAPLEHGSSDDRLLGMPVLSIDCRPIGISRFSPSRLARRLFGGLALKDAAAKVQAPPPAPPNPYCERVVECVAEINDRHGTGLLIQYLFHDFRDLATVNTVSAYGGERVSSAIHHQLRAGRLQRHDVYAAVLEWFRGVPPRQAYVAPYYSNDLYVAMALKDLFGTHVCLHIMDDNNVYSHEIPQPLMREALEKADLRLAISAEMRLAYEQRYGLKFWLLPPLVPDELIWRGPTPSPDLAARGVLMGNVWSESWLDLLRQTVRESGLSIDWFCSNHGAAWLKTSAEELARDGIHVQQTLPAEDLVRTLRDRPFMIAPSGELGNEASRPNIARLSLPSRLPFAAATARIPMIVLGSRETAAARFVERFGLGAVSAYEGPAFREAVRRITLADAHRAIRDRAGELGPAFSAAGMGEWVWQSLAGGLPADERFETLFRPGENEFAYFLDASPPREIQWNMQPLWHMLRRLRCQGIHPELIIDVGASTGVWSWTAAKVFPEARYALVEPMFSRYQAQARQHHLASLPRHEIIEAALSNRPGRCRFLVSEDLYNSSVLRVNPIMQTAEEIEVESVTLDELAGQRQWSGPALVKIDVQFAEHLVVEGGARFLQTCATAVILELTLEREHPEARTYREMLGQMEELGYRHVDSVEGWRDPRTGRLQQVDALFIRRESPECRAAA